MSCFKTYMFVKPGHFLYPDEKTIEGSTTLFSSLLTKCLEKNKFMLCEIIVRANTSPRLAALCPQAEELDTNRMQITPPGFQLHYLPFADDFRKIDQTIIAKRNIYFFKILKLNLNFFIKFSFQKPLKRILTCLKTVFQS